MSNDYKGVCGLRNLGNTCFFNAALQCVIALEPVAQFFQLPLSYTLAALPVKQRQLTGAFYQVLTSVWSGKYQVITPRLLHNCVVTLDDMFDGSSQHVGSLSMTINSS